jgi:hypothetical protein
MKQEFVKPRASNPEINQKQSLVKCSRGSPDIKLDEDSMPF